MPDRVFCPNCYARIPAAAPECPACGTRLSAWDRKSYGERLVRALTHPLADVRMRVIVALGLRRQRDAADALLACALRNPRDVTEGLAVIRALAQIYAGADARPALEALAARHPSRLIREAAAEALAAPAPEDGGHTGEV